MSFRCAVALIVSLSASAAAAIAALPAPDAEPPAPNATPPSPNRGMVGFIGAGSCSASACHGNLRPNNTALTGPTVPRVLQNEFVTWIESRDRHADAFRVLSEPRSQFIYARLPATLADAPSAAQAAVCLGCHALPRDPAAWARPVDLKDGVGCEACHGPAGSWLQDHFQRAPWDGGRRATAIRAGSFWDMRRLDTRSAKCAECHVGDLPRRRVVSHILIAAGHPRLYFEQTSFDATIQHWAKDDRRRRAARQWALGQIQALKAQAELTEAHAKSGAALDYSAFDCFACHHAVAREARPWPSGRGPVWRESARQGRYPERGLPGRPPLDPSHAVLVRQAALLVGADRWTALEPRVKDFLEATSATGPDAGAITASAQALTQALDALAAALNDNTTLDTDGAALALARSLVADDRVVAAGFMGAEQLYLALDGLTATLVDDQPKASLAAVVIKMREAIDDPARFDSAQFARLANEAKRILD